MKAYSKGFSLFASHTEPDDEAASVSRFSDSSHLCEVPNLDMSESRNPLLVNAVLTLSFSLFTLFATGFALAAKEDDETSTTGLDEIEASHLTFMREEEKLARDVYLVLSEMYPDQPLFSKIATQSEQTHTDTIRDRLEQLEVPDPNPETNDLPGSLGVYQGEEWGWYFEEKFEQLTAMAAESELAALHVGAFIEELDMKDITECPIVMVEQGYPNPCGLNYTDEPALINTFSSLIDGSENHLRAFVERIEEIIGEGNYKAQYVSQEEVDEILER